MTPDKITYYVNDISELFGYLYAQSNPGHPIPDDYCSERINRMGEYLAKDSAVIIGADRSGELLGFIWFFIKVLNGEDIIHVNHVVVNKDYQDHGVGTILMRKVEEYAHENKINHLELMVSDSNKKAILFYEKRGFAIDQYVMRKKID